MNGYTCARGAASDYELCTRRFPSKPNKGCFLETKRAVAEVKGSVGRGGSKGFKSPTAQSPKARGREKEEQGGAGTPEPMEAERGRGEEPATRVPRRLQTEGPRTGRGQARLPPAPGRGPHSLVLLQEAALSDGPHGRPRGLGART